MSGQWPRCFFFSRRSANRSHSCSFFFPGTLTRRSCSACSCHSFIACCALVPIPRCCVSLCQRYCRRFGFSCRFGFHRYRQRRQKNAYTSPSRGSAPNTVLLTSYRPSAPLAQRNPKRPLQQNGQLQPYPRPNTPYRISPFWQDPTRDGQPKEAGCQFPAGTPELPTGTCFYPDHHTRPPSLTGAGGLSLPTVSISVYRIFLEISTILHNLPFPFSFSFRPASPVSRPRRRWGLFGPAAPAYILRAQP